MARALILIGGTIMGSGLLYLQTAQHLGLQPIALSDDPTRYDHFAAKGVESIRVDTDDLDALIRECSRLRATYEIAGITGAADSFYATASKLCRHFDLPGPNPEAIEQCLDKYTQRQLLAASGVPMPAYRLAANAAEIKDSAAELGLPVIVKPAVGHSSVGVRLCRTPDEIAEHTTHLLGGEHIWRSSPRILVEEFAQGPYYSAEIMGEEVVAIGTGDFGCPPHFVCREFTFPALLSDDEHEHIANVSLSCLRALGLGWGPTNIEFRWTKRGPVVIEVNPRLAGTPFPQLVHLAYGVDLITEHIKAAIGEEWDLRRRHSQTAAARHLIADRDGTLDWINGDSQAAAVSGVADVKFYVEPKTLIERKGDYRDCIGHIIAASSSLPHTEAILQRAVDLIGWSITPFPVIDKQSQTCGTSPPGLVKENG
ncbi:acetyl-CoA carboxylase biotin carboxylase subunit family protein [Mesorhizobium sp. B283B1A]|uniref:ATP-grasp domain-containing protein n=1 Tax=Mesorhizobium TaxID=68287 RepID=UPI001CD0D2B9|nr:MULTISPECIES: acetyl-CoA carboxylase biotin carboxylase subunit family protein [Mesorhizobium]MCA0048281.1 acetyl-CoA carboxylase biotin carboxylase subunit family protein [Mesorhizobium sp. B283B1A]UQS64512.1 acetyl-CoA carboxylase biotin carboxylase subunit family protein [Mesorhizobium opportunistum]